MHKKDIFLLSRQLNMKKVRLPFLLFAKREEGVSHDRHVILLKNKIFLAVVIFAFLSILLWNVCFNRHSMTGVVIENKNQLKIEATEKDFVDSHGKYFVIRFEKGKENRNDDFLVGDQVIVKYDGIIYESNPAVIDAKSVKRKE